MKNRTIATQAICTAVFGCAVLASFADGIRWEQAKDITGDADVRTDGVLRYAYSHVARTVNGVAFSAGMVGHNVELYNIPGNVSALADITIACPQRQKCYEYAYEFDGYPSGVSDDYRAVLDAFCWSTASASISLRNLIPGHAYIVQLWVLDSREVGKVRSLKVDDISEVVYCNPTTGCGQHVTGSFTAVADTQAFTLIPYSTSPTYGPSAQFNAIQVRDVTPGCTVWEEPKDIVNDFDVRTEGETVFAIGWAPAASVVNGVTFVPQSATGELIGAGVSFEGGMTGHVAQAHNTGIEQALSDDYHRLMGGGVWKGSPVRVNLKGLVPGGRYLVQLWASDSRANSGSYRFMSVDGGARLAFRKASYGQHVTGTFTAVSDVQSILLRPFWSGTGANAVTQVNALQLRRLDSGAATHWRVNHITQSDHDVRLDGNLLYAYNFASEVTDTTVNGVTFKGFVVSGMAGSNDDIALAKSHSGGNDPSAFGFTDSDVSAGYVLMLQSATWGGTSGTLTLKRLVPGHRYLVQLWESDTRSQFNDRYVTLDNWATVRYRNAGVFNPPRGDVATGVFTAVAETHEVKMEAGHYSNWGARDVQLNGLQVRDLGAADSAVNVWAGGASGAWGEDATNWNDPAGSPREGTPWNVANGGTNTAVFAAATSAALPSADIAANGIVSSGALTIGEANDGRSIDVGFVEARSCTFKSGWAARTLAKYDLGSFTLEGASPNLAQVVAGGGSLAFSRADALKTGADRMSRWRRAQRLRLRTGRRPSFPVSPARARSPSTARAW